MAKSNKYTQKAAEQEFKKRRSPEKNARSKERNIRRQDERRKTAEARNTKWASLSIEVQLKELSKRPGKSIRQRTRLLAKQSNAKLAS